ncbi:unnamed protein product [Rotaria sp. Silwood2]|nr:unnamed protein product [Rotaria sp. Silwood2]
MLGINYKNPGEWQKTLHGRSEVHGVIFLLSGINPRESALGELPRIKDYCSNLDIPMLFIYRDGFLNFAPRIRIYADTHEIEVDDEEAMCKIVKTKFLRYQNLQEVKGVIAQTFANAQQLHQLLDPIVICGHVKMLREENENFKMEIKSLEQNHRNIMNEQKKEYDNQISLLNELLVKAVLNVKELKQTIDKISEDNQKQLQELIKVTQSLNSDNEHLRLKNEDLTKQKSTLEKTYTNLYEEKDALLIAIREAKIKQQQLEIVKNKLDNEVDNLTRTKDNLEKEKDVLKNKKLRQQQRMRHIAKYVENKMKTLVVVSYSDSEQSKKIKQKTYQRGSFTWLPGAAYWVAGEYDNFGKNIEEFITNLRQIIQSSDINIISDEWHTTDAELN